MQPLLNKLDGKLSRSAGLRRVYMLVGVCVLGLTTAWWALLGAQVQQNNADQLVDGFLFENPGVFHAAYFPGSHTFLLKWPLFYLLKVVGYSSTAYIGLTVVICLITVAAIAYLLWRIVRQPMVFGTFCLLLASVLIILPAQVFPGSTSPFNMAMLTTRNLEYVVYIYCLVLLVKSVRLKSWQFIVATLLLTLLVASDKLFAGMSIGGAIIGLSFYACLSYFQHRKNYRPLLLMIRWLVASILAFYAAAIVLGLLNQTTHIVNDGANIYGTVRSARAATQGAGYAVNGLFDNFGVSLPHTLPISFFSRLVNLATLLAVCFAIYKVIRRVVDGNAKRQSDKAQLLAITLLASTVAAVALFAGSQLAYVLYGRYLAIAVPAGFVVLALWAKENKLRPSLLALVGLIASVGVLCAIPTALHATNASKQRFSDDALVIATLKKHPVDVLVGNYWEVLPIKSRDNSQKVMPLMTCVRQRNTLTSQVWRVRIPQNSFAYLLSTPPTGSFPPCTKFDVLHVFGPPLETQVISGSRQNPKKILMFYNFDYRSLRTTRLLPSLR